MMEHKRVLHNAGWIIGCKIAQSVLVLLLTMLTARYLGPAHFGLLHYAAALVAFAAPISKLGLDAILVKALLDAPEREGETLGTAMGMSLLSSLLCIAGLLGFSALTNSSEPLAAIVCLLYSLILIFQSMELLQFWFQAHLLSKYTAIAALIAYGIKSAYQLVLLMQGSNIYFFCLTGALDILMIDLMLFGKYKRISGGRLTFSPSLARRLFAESKYHLLSAMMIAVFANTDGIMIKLFLGDIQTGYYSAAVGCANITSFVFSALIYSAQPVLLEKFRQQKQAFDETFPLLYAAVIFLSLLQCLFISLFAPFLLRVLYGEAYLAAANPLRMLVWYTLFSYLGAVRNIWIIANEKHSLLWKINLTGAVANILLNLIMIPRFSISGAAAASLITQVFTNVFLCFLLPSLRETLPYLKGGLRFYRCFQAIRKRK